MSGAATNESKTAQIEDDRVSKTLVSASHALQATGG